MRTTVREPATTITSPTRESSALRWVPSSTAAPMPAIRMPAPLTISWPSTKESPAHTSQVAAGAAKGNRRRASRTSTAEVIPTRPSTNSGPARVLQVVARDGRHRGHERGDDDQEVETMPGEEQPDPAHVVTVRRPRRQRRPPKGGHRVVVRYPREAAFRRRAPAGRRLASMTAPPAAPGPNPRRSSWTPSTSRAPSSGPTTHHRGYYAGDFSDPPFPTQQQLDLLVHLPVPGGSDTPR